jgi:hypothetical protein
MKHHVEGLLVSWNRVILRWFRLPAGRSGSRLTLLMVRLVSIFVVLTMAACDCGSRRLQRTLPPGVRVDSYLQQAASKIDVLWVVDNSGSMVPRQENLATNFRAFINEFTSNAVDYRIGVTTTDIFKEAGRLVGTPAVLSPRTPNVLQTFAANVRVGTSGNPYEVGLEAARMAIERQRASNSDMLAACQQSCSSSNPACPSECETKTEFPFLRSDAYLYIIFVTDEEDRSNHDVRYFYRFFENAKGLGNDGTVTTAAIMGEVPETSCGAVPGTRYKELSELTGGEVGSICDSNFSETLKKLASNAVGLKRKFALQLKPNLETLQVTLKYPCNVEAEKTAGCETLDREACGDSISDALNVVCTPRQGVVDGWSYEATNNVVYFAGSSVPGLSAQIELQYYEEGKGP